VCAGVSVALIELHVSCTCASCTHNDSNWTAASKGLTCLVAPCSLFLSPLNGLSKGENSGRGGAPSGAFAARAAAEASAFVRAANASCRAGDITFLDSAGVACVAAADVGAGA